MASDGFWTWERDYIESRSDVTIGESVHMERAWRASRKAAMEKCCAALSVFDIETYPIDVFPQSNSAAEMARRTIRNCERAIRRAFADDAPVVEEPKSFANIVGALAGPEFADLDEMVAETLRAPDGQVITADGHVADEVALEEFNATDCPPRLPQFQHGMNDDPRKKMKRR